MKKIFRSLICFSILVILFMLITNVSLAAYMTNVQPPLGGSSKELREIYVSEDNIGYTSKTKASLPFGKPMTSLSFGSNSNEVSHSENNKSIILLSNTDYFSLNITFSDVKQGDKIYDWYTDARVSGTNIKEQGFLSYDSWGSTQKGKNKQTVLANNQKIATGEIGTGAIIIQTSKDGLSWIEEDKEKFAKGLYTTNLLNYYHGTTQKYYLDGDAIKQGVYVSVSFFYELKLEYTYYYTCEEREWYQYLLFGIPLGKTHTVEYAENKERYYNICERYNFYVIEDNPEVITFNNLTIADTSQIESVNKPSSENFEEYKIQQDQYNNYINSVINRITPTMQNGDMTTTGFRINVTSNPYLSISVMRNGSIYQLPKMKVLDKEGNQKVYEINTNGKYEITIKSYSKTKKVTLYIDNSDFDSFYKKYFGENVDFDSQNYGDQFLDYSPQNIYKNERIFDENSSIPVFRSPLTLNLKKITDTNNLPLYGKILNKSTGEVIDINTNQIILDDYGEYQILFYTNKSYYDYIAFGNTNINMSGDVKVISFNFKVVGEDNHTTINEKLLSQKKFNDLFMGNPSDYIPKFYGVTRASSGKGKVIIAFSNKEEALKYAKEVVWSEFELHIDKDGKTYWKIPNINNPLGAKVDSYSGWENAKVLNILANQMVEEHYFDLTKIDSYLTINKSVSEIEQEGIQLNNLQLESLNKSIIIWYDEEQRINSLASMPIINDINIIKLIGKQKGAVLLKDNNGSYTNINEIDLDYFFVKDDIGIDSYTITATDKNNIEHKLNYEVGLYAQLEKLGLDSGLIYITEKNVYNKVVANYYIYFVKEGYQPTILSLDIDGKRFNVDSNNNLERNVFNYFKIEDVTNYIDQYTFIRITKELDNQTSISYYSIEQAKNLKLSDSGYYKLAVIDRFGNSYECSFSIK